MLDHETGPYVIETNRLFDLVDRQRAMRRLPPVDNTVKATRLNLKFNIATGNRLDFSLLEVTLQNEAALDALTRILNEQFRIGLEGELFHLASAGKKRKAAAQVQPDSTTETPSSETGTWPKFLRRVFGKRGNA